MLQIIRTPQVFDVVVVGSGAGGGTAVKVLTDRGLNVALLEAGPMLTPSKDFKEHVLPYQVDHRGAGAHAEMYFGRQQWGYFSAPNGYWDIPGEPYTVAQGNQFRWFRSRIIGGRTNHYGRISLRFSDYDFQPEDGLSDPWPVTYEEMSPWYDKAEGFIGVTGTKEGLRTAPDGNFLPPIPPRVHEQLIQKACGKLNIPCIPSRMAMLTKPFNGRAACHYCGQCGRGCQTASAFSSSQAMIFPAMKTGRLTVITGAMARELVSDASGKVTAVSYVDKATRTEKQVRCKAVVVAASACESARLLLNSKSGALPRRDRQFLGRGGAQPDGHRGLQHERLRPGAGRHAAAQQRRNRRHARLRAVVAVRRQEQGLPARLPHRDRRRIRNAGARFVCRAVRAPRRLWKASSRRRSATNTARS